MVVVDRSTHGGLAVVALDRRSLPDCDDQTVTAYRGHVVPVAALPVAALLLLGSFAFVHLTALPPYEDEGSQLRWIWRIIDAGEWLQPLGDGKPLEAWPMV